MVAGDCVGQAFQIGPGFGRSNLYHNISIGLYVGIQGELISAESNRFAGDRVFFSVCIFQRGKTVYAPLGNPESVVSFSAGRIAVVQMIGSAVIQPHLVGSSAICLSQGPLMSREYTSITLMGP